ncbi:MAG: LptF/LptG family permease [Oligoflexales bacterium]
MTLFFYFFKEIIPQFVTSFCVLGVVIVISQLLRLSEIIVTSGLSVENVLLPFLFIMAPFLTFTIPMAFMFATLIGFSRLSSDGEFTAMLANGYSVRKAVMPVLILGGIFYGITVLCALNFEPWGRRELINFFHRKAQTELDNLVRIKLKSGTFLTDFLGYVLYAENVSSDRSHLTNVLLAPGGGTTKDQNFTLFAPTATIMGSVENGDLTMLFNYGVMYSGEGQEEFSVVKFKSAELDMIRMFQEQILGSEVKDDYRSYPPRKLWHYIDEIRDDEKAMDSLLYYKARFLLHQRIAMPFAIIAFGLFAVVLGIHDDRKGKNWGYVGSILTIISNYILIMGFKWLAERGKVSGPVGAWLPHIILLVIASFLIYQKNRLPPSELTLDPKNFPFFGNMLKKRALQKSSAAT